MANASSSGVSSLRSRFEPALPPPEPVRKDRVKSMVDAPRPQISGEAARARDMARKTVTDDGPLTPTAVLPQERASDSEEARRLKRAILTKDADLREALQKLQGLAQQLERLVDRFSSSVVADDFNPSTTPKNSPGQPISAFSGDSNSPVDLVNQRDVHRRTAATSSQPTSLEAILAAARGGSKKVASGTERPKYAKLLRDMK